MQINYVIVALAGRHAQPRVNGERRLQSLGSLRYSDLFNYSAAPAFSPVRFRSGDLAAEQTWLPRSRQAEANERVIAFALDKAGCGGR